MNEHTDRRVDDGDNVTAKIYFCHWLVCIFVVQVHGLLVSKMTRPYLWLQYIFDYTRTGPGSLGGLNDYLSQNKCTIFIQKTHMWYTTDLPLSYLVSPCIHCDRNCHLGSSSGCSCLPFSCMTLEIWANVICLEATFILSIRRYYHGIFWQVLFHI